MVAARVAWLHGHLVSAAVPSGGHMCLHPTGCQCVSISSISDTCATVPAQCDICLANTSDNLHPSSASLSPTSWKLSLQDTGGRGSILPDTVSNIDTTQAELCSPPGQHQLQVLVLSSLSLVLTYIFTFLSRRQVGGHRQATTDVKLGETVHQSLSLPPT